MKSLLLTACLLIFSLVIFSQQTKKQTKEIGAFSEVYYTIKKTDIISGNYFIIKQESGDTIVKGQFLNGLRDGYWTYFIPGSMEKYLIYDFTADSILSYKPDFFANYYLIHNGETYVESLVDRPLIFVGIPNELILMLAREIKLPIKAKDGETGTSVIGFFVDETGKITGNQIIDSYDPKSEQTVNAVVNSFSDRLIPPLVNGKPSKSMFVVRIDWNGITFMERELPYVFGMNMSVHQYNMPPAYQNQNSNNHIVGPLERQYEYRIIKN